MKLFPMPMSASKDDLIPDKTLGKMAELGFSASLYLKITGD